MRKKTYHVVAKIGGGWSVRKEGAERALEVFESVDQAIDRGRKIARREGTDLIVHRRDGTVKESRTYGKDPHASKARAR